MVQTTFEMIREKYRNAQAERNRELERERKKIKDPCKDSDDEKPPREKKHNLSKMLIKLFSSEKS